jgi:tetratricopeptide (TPR) repeat protein
VGAFHGPLAQKKLEALAVATGREEAKQLSAQKSKLDVSTSAVDGRLRVQYPGVDFFAPDKKQRVRLAEIELSEKYGLKSSATVSSTNGNLHESISQLMKLAQTQNTCILRVPDHAMAISTDPKSNTYRFFDPNIGVYVFDNPREFAEQVIHFVNMNYNKSTYSPYNTHPLSKVGGGPQPPLSTMSAHHQLSVKQALLGADRSLGSGICAAMSNHVARWFLEHPGHTEPITSEMLGLDEFQPQIALARRGDTLQQHRFMEKARETYLDAADSMPGGRQLIANMDALEQKDGLNAVIKHLADQLQKNPNDPLLVALQKSYSAKHEQFTFRAKAALAKGDALYKLGKYDAALQKYLPGLSGLVTGNVHSVLLTSGKSGTDEALKHVAILLQVGPYDLSLILLAKTLLAAKQAGRSIGILPPRVESQAPSIVVGPAAASQAAAQPDATGQFFLMFTPVALQK